VGVVGFSSAVHFNLVELAIWGWASCFIAFAPSVESTVLTPRIEVAVCVLDAYCARHHRICRLNWWSWTWSWRRLSRLRLWLWGWWRLSWLRLRSWSWIWWRLSWRSWIRLSRRCRIWRWAVRGATAALVNNTYISTVCELFSA